MGLNWAGWDPYPHITLFSPIQPHLTPFSPIAPCQTLRGVRRFVDQVEELVELGGDDDFGAAVFSASG